MNMRLSSVILFLLINFQVFGQSKVEYGSNNGQYLEIDNTKIYYEQYGEGSPILLLHGGMGSISNFNTLIPDLSKHFKLIAIDSPSHGRSYSIDSLSYNILADYVVKIVDKLKFDKIDIVGYSDGAIIGMLVAYKIPNKINKIVSPVQFRVWTDKDRVNSEDTIKNKYLISSLFVVYY